MILTKKNQKYFIQFLIGIFALVGWFYWFQWKPVKIKQKCHKQAVESAILHHSKSKNSLIGKFYPVEEGTYTEKDYQFYLDQCLDSKGFE